MPDIIRGRNTNRDDDMDASALFPSQNTSNRGGASRPRSYDGAHIPFQPGHGVASSERNIWRLFESYKRSAILHTTQLLQYNSEFRTNRSSLREPGSPERGEYLLPRQCILASRYIDVPARNQKRWTSAYNFLGPKSCPRQSTQ